MSYVIAAAVTFVNTFPYGHGRGQGRKNAEDMLPFGKYLMICNI